MTKRDFKFCDRCKTKFYRSGERGNHWATRRFCNDDCQNADSLERRRIRKAEAKRKRDDKHMTTTDFWLYRYRPVGV